MEDQDAHTSVIPELRFQRLPDAPQSSMEESAAATAAVEMVAKNVLLFRVDSLEGDPIGTAVLIREWQEVR